LARLGLAWLLHGLVGVCALLLLLELLHYLLVTATRSGVHAQKDSYLILACYDSYAAVHGS